MNLQKLYSLTRQGIDKYNMIEAGDKIAIGVSGGKDSLTLLYALAGLRNFYPKKFDIVAISVNLGLEIQNFDKIQQLCDELEIKLYVVDTQINEIVFEKHKQDNPCSLCAKLRKGALNEKALELGCNKIAYAHHKDDLIETMMLSLIYEGRFCSFLPVTYWDKTKLVLIRPFIMIPENDIKGFCNKYNVPVAKNPCSVDGRTKREYVKQLIKDINRDNPGVKERMYTAILNGRIEGWPNECEEKIN